MVNVAVNEAPVKPKILLMSSAKKNYKIYEENSPPEKPSLLRKSSEKSFKKVKATNWAKEMAEEMRNEIDKFEFFKQENKSFIKESIY